VRGRRQGSHKRDAWSPLLASSSQKKIRLSLDQNEAFGWNRLVESHLINFILFQGEQKKWIFFWEGEANMSFMHPSLPLIPDRRGYKWHHLVMLRGYMWRHLRAAFHNLP
jgi:hypothetical protein